MSRIVAAIWLVFCSSRFTMSTLCCSEDSTVYTQHSHMPHSLYLLDTVCSAPLPCLPDLANTELPALRHKAAVDRLIEKTALQKNWPLHKYVFYPSCNCLPSSKPLWTDTHPIDVTIQWQDDWKSALVVDSSIVDDPTIRQPEF